MGVRIAPHLFYCGGWMSSSWMKQQDLVHSISLATPQWPRPLQCPLLQYHAELNIGGTQIACSFAPNAFRQRGFYVF